MAIAARISFAVGYFDPVPSTKPLPKSPVAEPDVECEDDVLLFKAQHHDYTLQLFDSEGDLAYSFFVPSSITTVNLPSTLSGEYELRLYPADGSSYYFYGYVLF